MNLNKQRIAIAEHCGKDIPSYTLSEEYVDDPHWNSGFWETTAIFKGGLKLFCNSRLSEIPSGFPRHNYAWGFLPDYLNDLNAMHEAEKLLTDEQWTEYYDNLLDTTKPSFVLRDITHATATQRAEAFLKTIEKWQWMIDDK